MDVPVLLSESPRSTGLDGLVAVGSFLVDLAAAVADWGMALAGTVGEAAQAAGERVRGTLAALFAWVRSLFLGILDPVLVFPEAWGEDVAAAGADLLQAAEAYDGSFGSMAALGRAIAAFLGALFHPQVVLAMGLVSLAITAAYLAVMATGVGAVVVGLIVSTVITQLVAVLLEAVAPALESALAWLAGLVDSNVWLGAGATMALLGVGVAFFARFGATSHPVVQVIWDLKAPGWDFVRVDMGTKIENVKSNRPLALALLSLAIAVASAAVNANTDLPAILSVFVDIGALYFGLRGLQEALIDPAKVLYGRLTLAISGAAVGYSAASLTGHLYSASQGE